MSKQCVYDFSGKDIDGNNVALSNFKGKVLLIVNVASCWGKTKTNYEQLQELYKRHQQAGLEILAFPCGQFLSQEYDDNAKIKDFVRNEKGVTFHLFERVNVNGSSAHPLWAWMKTVLTGFITNDIKWNFSKFLFAKDGTPLKRFSPNDDPFTIEKDILEALK